MRILHVSDIHLPAPRGAIRFLDLLHPKRVLGWGNLTLRRSEMFAEGLLKLEAIVDIVRRDAVDLTLFTGDVSSLGTVGELSFCRKALTPLIDASPEFICMPGNHDIYLSRDPWNSCFSDLVDSGKLAGVDPDAWPGVYDIGECRIVTLDSTKPNPHLFSTGIVPEGQMKRLREAMQTERRLLIALHHGPFGSDGTPDRRSHGLVNCDAFLELLRDAPRGTILLHGHTHHQFVLRPEGLPVMVCAGSANHAGRESMWMVDLLPGEESRVSSGHWDGERFSFDEFVAV